MRGNPSIASLVLSDQYARFLEEELQSDVAKRVKITNDPSGRAICGNSSGDSITNIRGGDVYPGRIRETEPKPIRVFLQDGVGDLDNQHGPWPYANFKMAIAFSDPSGGENVTPP